MRVDRRSGGAAEESVPSLLGDKLVFLHREVERKQRSGSSDVCKPEPLWGEDAHANLPLEPHSASSFFFFFNVVLVFLLMFPSFLHVQEEIPSINSSDIFDHVIKFLRNLELNNLKS